MLITAYTSIDPCYNYTVLDDPWRATNNTSVGMCDTSVTWSGWYRLFINNVSAQIPDTCVAFEHCGTRFPLWIRGGHPTVQDGVVTRDVCGNDGTYCCYYGSYPIKVKACPGNFYVYELIVPTLCNSAYCAVQDGIVTRDVCGDYSSYCCYYGSYPIKVKACPGNYYVYELSQTSGECFQNLLEQIENITVQVLPLNIVTNILTVAFNASEKMLESLLSANPTELASYGNRMLKTSKKLISTLVKPTDTSDKVSFTLSTVEGQIFMVGPNVAVKKIPQLDTTYSSVDIDLIGIAKNNNERSAAVAFMSFNKMENLLKPDFFNTSNDTVKTMMSTVISVTLPKTTNTKLTKPVNFTFRHIREFDPNGSLSCVYWNISEWIVDGCSVLKTNSSYTVCSCVHLSTFALIMQTSRPREIDSLLDLLNLVCVSVGLVFFSLALLTFAFCQWSPKVNNVARINICISLLLAHLLFLLTQQFLSIIRPHQVLCAAISGILHFFFLSGFVWMFIEAVMLYICVRNLSQISSKRWKVLRSGYLCVIGYMIALVVVCVSVGLVPEGYGSEHCWIKTDKGFVWSFLGPVCIILAANTFLFIKIFISLNSALKSLNAEVSQMKQTKIMVFKTLAQCVVLGCPWILGFFTEDSKGLEILFLIVNSQQGTFIFLIYCVLNNEVRQQYMKFFRCLCCLKKE
ncbi:adhesion G protein-coupled receptor E3-like [Garra rufa]|uniref:adhesion G protein-coupled receptor E3-like n=1 Tax=Garra rufa TaxID=137080 RepID=UPI003CCE7BC1